MSRSLKRLTITAAVTQALQLPSLLKLYNKSSRFLFPLLRRVLSKAVHFMESLLFSNDDDDFLSSPFDQSFLPPSFSDPGESLFLVSFRWWMEAVCGGGVADEMNEVGGVVYNATVRMNGGEEGEDNGDEEGGGVRGFRDSEILVGMRREGETLISGEEGAAAVDGDLALVSEWMFFTALKWHYDNKDVDDLLSREDSARDAFSLQIRIFYDSEINQLIIKIIQKDNEAGAFSRVCRIFFVKPEMLQIWDFSGQTKQFFLDRKSSMNSGQSNEIQLELQVYDVLCTIMDMDRRKAEVMVDQSMVDVPSSSSSFRMNGTVDKVNFSPGVGNGFSATNDLGLAGLYNLGNTCFMNSAIQCLVHTPKLVDYFLGNFRKDLNFENPLGMNGKLAIAFGDLLRKLWAPGETAVSPRMFKSTISSFAPQFSGYNQHDSQEFLSFLLDGLHEDLNRVKRKPYVQAKDEDDRPDEVVADEYWGNHLSRNDSIVVDLCQGQYRSTLVCPICKKSSVTFDPFMYLSLPLPSSALRTMTLTVLSTDGTTLPHPVTIKVPDNGTFKDLREALSIACSLKDNETLLIAEVYNNSILRVLDDPGDSIELVRDYDQLVAYRLLKDMDGSPLIVFMHQQVEKSYLHSFPSWKRFGIPLVTKMSDFSKGSEMQEAFLKLINPLLLPDEFMDDDATEDGSAHEGEEVELLDHAASSNNKTENDSDTPCNFEFFFETRGFCSSNTKIEMDEPIPISETDVSIKVLVSWPKQMIRRYDTSMLNSLPEVCKPALSTRWNQDSISLYKCVDAFLKEEPLGPDDMWYCPKCKDHRQASKKLDLWRLPEILVIHLKRFSYTRFLKNKLESFINFPVEDFDLSNYVIQKKDGVCHRYTLYAVSNHYGGMGGGHYTAFAKHRMNQWYEFDDSHVLPVAEDQIKTQAAYVLFYKRM